MLHVNAGMNFYLDQIADTKLLEPEEERLLACRWAVQRDQWAREQILSRNLPFVVYAARPYRGKGLDMADLVQEGNAAMTRALDRFDPFRSPYVRLVTYAKWWIRDALTRAVNDKTRAVKLPGRARDLAARFLRVRREMRDETGAEPTLEDVAARIGKSADLVRRALDATGVRDYPLEHDGEALIEPRDVVRQIFDRGDRNEHHERLDRLRTAMEKLGRRERLVVSLRFGLPPARAPLGLDAIAAKLGLDVAAARRLYLAAVSTLARTAARNGNGRPVVFTGRFKQRRRG